MTYEEFKEKVAKQIIQKVKEGIWFDSSEEAIKKKFENAIQSTNIYLQAMCDIDTSLHTTVADLLEAFAQAGFPKEKITVIKENKAQIILDDTLFTLHGVSPMHTLFYEGDNYKYSIDLIHTPAEIPAAYFVERFYSGNWQKLVAERWDSIVKLECKKQQKKKKLLDELHKIKDNVSNAILNGEDYEQHREQYLKFSCDYFSLREPEDPDSAVNSAISDWENMVRWKKNELTRLKRAKVAHKRYEEVTKPKRQAEKQKTIEEKRALLQEFKSTYGVECKFIDVHSPFDPHHRFVVPAVEGQVVSFFVPEKFDHAFYDRAMQLVAFLNQLTATYGKAKVQKKGSLPAEAQKQLLKLQNKLNIHRQWHGIFDESKRHYLSDEKYEEIVLTD